MTRRPGAIEVTTSLTYLGEAPVSTDERARFVPHVVAWNLTRRCNLKCAHCYIAAGPTETAQEELGTDECLRITEEILAVNPNPMFILSGGEPLLREDLTTIAAFATRRGATVVVGTNGSLLSDARIEALMEAGVRGVAVSVESLDPTYHDRFRRGHGSLMATREAVERLQRHGLDFVIQTTLTRGNRHELRELVKWSAAQGAVSFNAYFLVSTGRGAGLTDLSPQEYEDSLVELVDLHVGLVGTMMVRAKCAPHFMRLVHQRAPESPILNYATRCPCGVQYCRVTPDGKLTACPYLPLPAGDLRRERFADLWRGSSLFEALRSQAPGGKCGVCEYRAMCGGCRARAYAVEEDYLGADPSCVYEPTGDMPLVRQAQPVTYGMDVQAELRWSPAARARIDRVPSFVRGVVMKRVEEFARRQGAEEVTMELLRNVRRQMPVDFSRRTPFFLRDDD